MATLAGMEPQETAEAKLTRLTFAQFLEGTPPSQTVPILDLVAAEPRSYRLNVPEIRLYCPDDQCKGQRVFRYKAGGRYFSDGSPLLSTFITYLCSNCRKQTKLFALQVAATDPPGEGEAYKYGELPPFGPHTPPRLLRLFGKDGPLFMSGRRSEIQGLGIGAFTYYRRIVEAHKNQLFDEIIKVSNLVGADEALIKELEAAKGEKQFLKAVESIKAAIPQTLLIDGHNPLTLLHSALSQGVHDLPDDKCLELAHDIRVLLADFAERVGQAMKDDAELKGAVSRLMASRSEAGKAT